MRCKVGKKKVSAYMKKTGLPVIGASVRGGTDHRIDLYLQDGVIVYWYKDGTMEKADIEHSAAEPESVQNYVIPSFVER